MKMRGKCIGPLWLTKDTKHKFRRWRKVHMGGQDMVRIVDRQGEVLI